MKMALLSFFSDDDVFEAKETLCIAIKKANVKVDIQNEMPKRQNSASRSAKEATVDDILSITQKLDLVTNDFLFVSDDASKIPGSPTEGSSLLCVMEEMSSMKRQMTEMQYSMATMKNDMMMQANALDQIQQFPRLPSQNSVQPTSMPQSSGHHSARASSYSTAVKEKTTPESVEPTAQAEKDANDDDRSKKDEDEFTVVKSKPRRPRGVVGTRTNTKIVSGADTCELFVSGINNRVKAKDVVEYISDQGVQVQDMKKVSHEEAKTQSFKVVIDKLEYNKMMNDEFWPEGVACRIYRSKQPWRTK